MNMIAIEHNTKLGEDKGEETRGEPVRDGQKQAF